jgi:hypothetical protein
VPAKYETDNFLATYLIVQQLVFGAEIGMINFIHSSHIFTLLPCSPWTCVYQDTELAEHF